MGDHKVPHAILLTTYYVAGTLFCYYFQYYTNIFFPHLIDGKLSLRYLTNETQSGKDGDSVTLDTSPFLFPLNYTVS